MDQPQYESGETLGTKCATALKAAKRKGDVPWPRVAAIIDEVIDADRFSLTPDTAEPKPKKRNPLVDGIIEACGHDPLKAAKPALATAGVAIAQIKAVHPDVNVAEIKRFAALYKRKNPTWALTPTAIAAHWHEFPAATQTLEPMKPDAYSEPANWREAAANMYPGIEFPAWSEISITIRQDIIRRLS